jgi:hypothetical protein
VLHGVCFIAVLFASGAPRGVAQGDPDTTLSTLSAVFGVTFVAAVVVLARRG